MWMEFTMVFAESLTLTSEAKVVFNVYHEPNYQVET